MAKTRATTAAAKTQLFLSVGSDGYWLYIGNPKQKALVHLSGLMGASDYNRTVGPALEEALELGCVTDNRK